MTKIIDEAIGYYEEKRHELDIFMSGVHKWFYTHPKLNDQHKSVIHSAKMRLKDSAHLREKLTRDKYQTTENAIELIQQITDLAGVRVLHLYQDQFPAIHNEILHKVNVLKDWHLKEPPVAYTWDPESKEFFEKKCGINAELKESFYTSVHYVIKPRADSILCCEIQVRTLFEEIWGETDHILNYPTPTSNLPCREQIRVLAKLVGAGSRLVDSIFRTASSP